MKKLMLIFAAAFWAAQPLSVQARPYSQVVINARFVEATTTVELSFYDSQGLLAHTARPLSVPPRGTNVFDVSLGTGLPPGSYSAVATADQPIVAVVNQIDPALTLDGYSAYNGFLAGDTSNYLPTVVYYPPGSETSSLAVQNVSSSASTGGLYFYQPDSTPAGTPMLASLPPLGAWSANLDATAEQHGLPPDFSGVGYFAASSEAAAVCWTSTPSATCAYSGVPPWDAGPNVYLPLVFDGSCGPTSQIFVKNIGANTGDVSITYFDPSGNQVYTESASFYGRLQNRFQPPPDVFPQCWGSAVVSAAEPIAAVVMNQSLAGDLCSYNGAVQGESTIVAPGAVNDPSSWSSWVTVQKVGGEQATCQYSFYDATGVLKAGGEVTLEPFGAANLKTSDLLGDDVFQGSAQISATGEVAVVVSQENLLSGALQQSCSGFGPSGEQTSQQTTFYSYLPLVIKGDASE